MENSVNYYATYYTHRLDFTAAMPYITGNDDRTVVTFCMGCDSVRGGACPTRNNPRNKKMLEVTIAVVGICATIYTIRMSGLQRKVDELEAALKVERQQHHRTYAQWMNRKEDVARLRKQIKELKQAPLN